MNIVYCFISQLLLFINYFTYNIKTQKETIPFCNFCLFYKITEKLQKYSMFN